MNSTTWSDRLLDAMMKANRSSATLLIEQAISEGIPVERIITDILDPTLAHLGRLWSKSSVSLAQTFVAAKIAEDILLRCMPEGSNESISPQKGAVVIGNIEDDFHSLGRRIVAAFLRANGWDVFDLGNDVLPEQFVDKAMEVGARVIGASAMMQTTALNIRKLRLLIDASGLKEHLKLAVGGAVFNWRPDLVAEVGGDGTTQNAVDVDSLFLELQAQAKGEPQP